MANEVVVHVGMGSYSRIERLMRRMRRRSQRVAQLTFEDAGDLVAEQNRRIFESEGAFGGRKWAPLKPKYAAWKFRMVGNKPILQFSEDLADSLTRRPMAVERIGEDYYEFGTDDPKAHWHQHGTDNMPARPPVQVTPWLTAELHRLVAASVVDD